MTHEAPRRRHDVVFLRHRGALEHRVVGDRRVGAAQAGDGRVEAIEGIEAEVVDLRSLRPIDLPTIAQSVMRTHRLLVVYEGVKTMGIGAEVAAQIAESEAFDFLDAPIARLGGADTPIPYNPTLERAAVPQEDDIVAAARRLVRRGEA